MINYKRRQTVTVNVGGVKIGSSHRVKLQSMTNTNTNDVEGSAEQCRRVADAGGDIVRLTAQGVREAQSIGQVRARLREWGYTTPLVADIHFNPRAAFEAAALTDKVRINPGNFVDPARVFKSLTYSDEEYAAELQRISDTLKPFIALCREHGTAVRLGVNHGSLSDRIMSRYGNTAAGMVESVMEFLRVFHSENFHDVVISMKASNVVVMIESVRRLVRAMDAEGMCYPLHLGVTEAGFGEDGRVKSAVGIGTLLGEGIGDTIRVSLSEEPEAEIPVARKLVDYITAREGHPHIDAEPWQGYDYLTPARRMATLVAGKIGGGKAPVVIADNDVDSDPRPDFTSQSLAATGAVQLPADVDVERVAQLGSDTVLIVSPANVNVPGSILGLAHRMAAAGLTNPIVAKVTYDDTDSEWLQVKAGADLGAVLMSGMIDGVWLSAPRYADQAEVVRIAFSVLQATRLRISHTEFISCPGCGRTMFDLQTTVRRVKEATSHLTHLKIGVMGCVVNGPGEMADADYGYVGAARNRISLYRGKECVMKNLPEEEAIEHLLALIAADGRDKQ